MRTRGFTVLAAALICASLAGPAQAKEIDQLLGLRIRNAVEHGKQRPALLFTPERKVKSLSVTLKRKGGKEIALRGGDIAKGREKALEFDQPAGTHAYEATIRGKWAAGGKDFGFVFTFEATSQPPLKVTLHKRDVDLDAKRMKLSFSRPVGKVWFEVKGDGARLLDSGEFAPRGGATKHLEVAWKSGEAMVEKISVRAWDAHGFWAGVEVTPFSVHIDHEEVEFEFGKADITPAEAPKLEGTLTELKAVLEKHGKEIEIQLYIAGYTDTVGSPQANRELSERRARSIAAWFRAQGIGVPIFYQGFGEDVLAVATPDNTPEARNRRAIYVLSAGPPENTPVVPRGDWKPLR